MGDVGPAELVIVLVVILLLFGGAKLPELARSLGKAKREFHRGLDEGLSAPGGSKATVDGSVPNGEVARTTAPDPDQEGPTV